MASEKIKCDMCSKLFNPRTQPHEFIGKFWVCCADMYTPEELVDALGIEEGDTWDIVG
jgi:hypothetical protein